MLDSLIYLYDHPAWLIGIVVVSTFMLEDLAIIGAALLAASGKIDPVHAWCAVVLGIFIGDSALYAIGRLVHIWPWLKRKMAQPMIQSRVAPLKNAAWHQLAWIRGMPGLRTFGYIACGVAKVPAYRFSVANLVSIWVWAGVIYITIYYLGRQYAESMEQWLWWCLPIALLIFALGHRRNRTDDAGMGPAPTGTSS